MSKNAKELLEVLGKIKEQEDTFNPDEYDSVEIGDDIGGDAEIDLDDVAQGIVDYLNDKFADLDFSVVDKAFDTETYQLKVQFAPKLPDGADVAALSAELADVFDAKPEEVEIVDDTINVSLASEMEGEVESLKTEEGFDILEVSPKKMISFAGGKKHIKMQCPPGFKLVDGKSCVKMTAAEVKSRAIGAKKRVMKMKSKMGQISKARAKTMKLRAKAGL